MAFQCQHFSFHKVVMQKNPKIFSTEKLINEYLFINRQFNEFSMLHSVSLLYIHNGSNVY